MPHAHAYMRHYATIECRYCFLGRTPQCRALSFRARWFALSQMGRPLPREMRADVPRRTARRGPIAACFDYEADIFTTRGASYAARAARPTICFASRRFISRPRARRFAATRRSARARIRCWLFIAADRRAFSGRASRFYRQAAFITSHFSIYHDDIIEAFSLRRAARGQHFAALAAAAPYIYFFNDAF